MKKKKHVYLIGTSDNGYYAHSYNKSMAKAYIKQFKNKKYVCKKVKLTSELNQRLVDENLIFDLTYAPGMLLTEAEEMYMLDAFEQFKTDTEHSLQTIIGNAYYLKLTDFERKQLTVFSKFIFNTIRKSENSSYENENDEFDIFDYSKITKFFIKHVLDAK